MRTRFQSYDPVSPAGQEGLPSSNDMHYPIDLAGTPSVFDMSGADSPLTPCASPFAATPEPSAFHTSQEQQPDSSSILADDSVTPKKADDSITDYGDDFDNDDGSVYDAFGDMSCDEDEPMDADDSDDSYDELMTDGKKKKRKTTVRTRIGKQAKQTNSTQPTIAASPSDTSDDSVRSRLSHGKRDNVHNAPPTNTDLPWTVLGGITSEELLAFFPNHCIKWPAIAARLIEDGWMPRRVSDFINKSRALTSPAEIMLGNTVQISMNKACAVFYGKESYSMREEVQKYSERTPDEVAAAKNALTTRTWEPKKSGITLQPAWTLAAIASAFVGSELSFPCKGAFTTLMLAATTDPSFVDPTQSTNEPRLHYDIETGSAQIIHKPLSHAIQNPPALPEGWTPYYLKSTRKRIFTSPDPEERQQIVKQPKTDSLRLNARKKWIGREDLPANIQNNANAIIEGYPHLLAGELILWLISKTGGKKTVTQIHAQLVKKFGKKKAIDRSTLAYRKISALKERAKKNGTDYDTEYRKFERSEFRHVREKAAPKKRKGVSAQEETVDEDDLEQELTEPTGPKDMTTSYPLNDTDYSFAAPPAFGAPAHTEFTFEHDMTMPMSDYNNNNIYMSSPELQDSINAWLDHHSNNDNDSNIAPLPIFSGAGLGLDFSQVDTYLPAQAHSTPSQQQSAGSGHQVSDNDGDSPMGNAASDGIEPQFTYTFDEPLDHETFCEQYQFDTSSPRRSSGSGSGNASTSGAGPGYGHDGLTALTSDTFGGWQQDGLGDVGFGVGMEEKHIYGNEEGSLEAFQAAGLDQEVWDDFVNFDG